MLSVETVIFRQVAFEFWRRFLQYENCEYRIELTYSIFVRSKFLTLQLVTLIEVGRLAGKILGKEDPEVVKTPIPGPRRMQDNM